MLAGAAAEAPAVPTGAEAATAAAFVSEKGILAGPADADAPSG